MQQQQQMLPLYLSEEEVDLVVTTGFPGLKNPLTLIKEQNGIIDFGLSKDKPEVLVGFHHTERRKVDQQNLEQ